MHSCLYEGTVAHHRREPIVNRFRYRMVMAYLDLDELPELVGPGKLLPEARWGLATFLRSDRLFDSASTLRTEVRELCEKALGEIPNGPIRMLTQLRWFGYYFSPLNLYYLFGDSEEGLRAVVAEVNNTPWGERHVYVLSAEQCDADRAFRSQHKKAFHVSPFMSMSGDYRWRLSEPGERLAVALERNAPGEKPFHASMVMSRRELSKAQLRRTALRFPAMTMQVTAAIYFQALKLWWKRCPYYPHPSRSPASPSTPQ